jgi:hypothetical protein
VVLLNSGTNAWDRFELHLHKHMDDQFVQSQAESVKQIMSVTI